jgi:hypothetical protein
MSDAVFQEVLSIGIDTTAFNAQIEAAVAKYQTAMGQMNEAGSTVGVGNFGAAADQLNKLNQSADEGAGYFDKFGAAFETALVRVPARLIVFAALGAAIAAIAEPIRLVSEGFSDLENSQQGEGFRSTTESLDTLKVRLEEIAASPLFNFAGEELTGLKTWLTDNKKYAEQLALAFGNVAAEFAKALALFSTSDAVKGVLKGLAVLANDLSFALTTTLTSLTAISNLMGTLSIKDAKATWNNAKDAIRHPFDFSHKDQGNAANDQTEAITKAWADGIERAAVAHHDFEAALDGKGALTIPHVSAPSKDSRSDVMAQFREERDKAKQDREDAVESTNEQLHNNRSL